MQSLWIGAAGLHAGQRNMDVIAHDIANVNTTAFRGHRAVFRDELSVRLGRPAVTTPADPVLNGTGVSLAAVLPMSRPGSIERTEDVWNFAISGPGYFQVQAPDGEVLYTRDGAFAADAEGRFVGPDGVLLLDDDGDPVEVPDWAERFVVSADGIVTALSADETETLTVIGLARFVNATGLAARGHNLFAATPASGPAVVKQPGEDGTGTLIQGAIERSNVDLAEEMTAMLLAHRFFQLNARVIQTTDEMMALANRLTS